MLLEIECSNRFTDLSVSRFAEQFRKADLVAIYESSHEQMNLGVKTETSDIPPNREAW